MSTSLTPDLRLHDGAAGVAAESVPRQSPPVHRQAFVYRVAGIVLTIVVVVCLITYLVQERAALLAAVNRLSYLGLTGVVATLLAQWVARTVRDQLIYRELGYAVSFYRLFYIVLVQTLLNYLPMKPGTVYAAISLRRHAGLELPHFGAVVLVHNLLMIVVAAGSAAAVIAFHPASQTTGGRAALGFLIAVTLLSVLSALLLPRFSLRLPRRIGCLGGKLSAGFAVMRNHPNVLYSTIVLSCLTFIVSCLRLYLLYGCTSQSISFVESVVVSAAGQLAIVVSLTPAAIGIRELLVGLSSPLVAASTAAGIIAASIERAIILMCLLALVLPVQGRMLWRRFSTTVRLDNAA